MFVWKQTDSFPVSNDKAFNSEKTSIESQQRKRPVLYDEAML